jgi:hypothetical protein
MNVELPHRVLPALAALVALVLAASTAHAEPWFGWGDGKTEDAYEDGDISVEDIIDGTRVGRSRGGTSKLRAGTWVTLGGIFRVVDGKQDLGVLLLFSGAFDRVAQGRVHSLASPDLAGASFADGSSSRRPPAPAPPPAPVPAPILIPLPAAPPPSPPPAPLLITPAVAHRAVTSAWKTSGIGVDDARIDSMVARARASAALPETRLRVMKVINDSSHVGVIPTDTGTYDLAGADLYLEGRLTWRLDRLLYADDEPSLERTRLERQDARERIAGKVIDTLFQWQRALVAYRGAITGTKEAIDSRLRMAEAEAALDVLTGGWFGGWVSRQESVPTSTVLATPP